MVTTSHHRCHTMDSFGDETSLTRIIINRKDIQFPLGAEPWNGVYGALEVFSDDSDGDIECCFVLIGDDEDLQCPEFELKADFTHHIMNEARLQRPKTLVRKFDLSHDIGKMFNFQEHQHGMLMRHLGAQWLANYLATNFIFSVEINLYGKSLTEASRTIVTMTRPWSDLKTEFGAMFAHDELFVGQDSKFGQRFFGKAA